MKVTLVPSSVSATAGGQLQFLTSFLINDTVAVDAGGLGLYQTPQDQARVKHVLVTHSHIDHIASLPIFVENAYEGGSDCVTVYGTEAVLQCLRQDVFNNRLWPDFLALSEPDKPFLKLHQLEPGRPIEVEGLRFTPVSVNHVVPTTGFVIEDDQAAVVVVSDTGPTDEIWHRANAADHLQAVFLEATFPDDLAWLAAASKHLTPALFAQEARKLIRPADIIAVHIKPRFHAQVLHELAALNLPNLRIGRVTHTYTF